MRSLRKRHSWPPMRKSRSSYMNEKIDEDPFAYFISPAEDRDVFFESDLAAGIRNNRKSRSLSPFYQKSHRTLSCATRSPTTKLKKWIEKMERQYFHRGSHDHVFPIPESSKAPTTTSPPLRGRRDHRGSSSVRVKHNPRSPPRRPRAWREPSVGIWPVLEEQEDVGLGIMI